VHPAPELAEVARIWWDVDHDPVVAWDEDGRCFDLVDPQEPSSRLRLVTLVAPAPDPGRVAAALADGLAACDFPPNGDGVPLERAALTLRTNGMDLPVTR
jgi:hypothetical protein